MGFDARAFLREKFEPRILEVAVPDLKPWFGDGPPVWKVRGLTGDELGRVNEAVERHRNTAKILEGIVSPDQADKVQAMRDLLGISDRTPADIVKRLELLVAGSVDPPCDMELAIRLKDTFPVEFSQLTNEILRATGMGHVPGKPNGSGGSPPSEPA